MRPELEEKVHEYLYLRAAWMEQCELFTRAMKERDRLRELLEEAHASMEIAMSDEAEALPIEASTRFLDTNGRS